MGNGRKPNELDEKMRRIHKGGMNRVCFMTGFFSCKEKIKKFSEDGTHSLPTLQQAEKCTRSSCDNREVLLWTTAEVKKTRVFLSTRQLEIA